MTIDQQLKLDLDLYGVSVEQMVKGKRKRLDPRNLNITIAKLPERPALEKLSPSPGLLKELKRKGIKLAGITQ